MSIKIIKNTMVDPITVTCANCKSVFSYKEEYFDMIIDTFAVEGEGYGYPEDV